MEITKWRLFINFKKEEQWLNKMAATGLNLISYKFGRYTFEEGLPGEYIYRLELLKGEPTDEQSSEYLAFMEESGVECVDTYMNWAFFRKKAADGPFEIYSDFESKIAHYKRAAYLLGTVLGVNLFIALFNVTISQYNMYLSIVGFIIFVLFMPIFISYLRKINDLKKKQALYDK